MPRTKTTRVGNGKGWGGERKGASTSRFTAGDEHRGAHNKAAIISAEEDQRRNREVWREIRDDKKQPAMARITAADKIEDRIAGKAVQRNENTNTNVRRVIRAPAKPADAAEWMQQHSPQTTMKPN